MRTPSRATPACSYDSEDAKSSVPRVDYPHNPSIRERRQLSDEPSRAIARNHGDDGSDAESIDQEQEAMTAKARCAIWQKSIGGRNGITEDRQGRQDDRGAGQWAVPAVRAC